MPEDEEQLMNEVIKNIQKYKVNVASVEHIAISTAEAGAAKYKYREDNITIKISYRGSEDSKNSKFLT